MSNTKFSNITRATIYDGDWYGVSGLESSNTVLTRIGSNMTFHASLPIQSLMKACLLNDNGTVNYYLKPTDWSKKLDESSSNLDGSDGQVMIEIPEHYYLDWLDGTVQRTAISQNNLTGFYHAPTMYVGAYEAVAQRSTKKLGSLINTGTDYRGGNNNDAWDSQDNTLLGKCVTSLPIQENPATPNESYRDYAQNRGNLWFPYPWKLKNIINRFFMIEYGTKNCQTTYDATLTPEGYKKGGLGMGVTTISDPSTLITWNNRFPFVPIGQSNSLGNSSGTVSYSVPYKVPSETVNISRYRGIENVFGHMMELIDGIAIERDIPNGRFKAWLFDNPSDFSSSQSTNGRLAGYIPVQTVAGGVLKKINLNDMIPIEVVTGATYSIYFADGIISGDINTTNDWNHCRCGGGYADYSVNSDSAGLFWIKCEDHYYLPYNYISSRVACLPNGY